MQGVLVTGGGRRLGAAIARHMGAKGWHVFVHHNQSAEGAREVVADIIAQGGRATAVGADLGNTDEVEQLYRDCEAICPLEMLVNSASGFEYDTAASVSPAGLEAHMRVNLFAPVLLTRNLHASLAARGAKGLAINIVDNKVFGLNPDYFSYSLSKVALQGMIQMQAMAMAPTLRVAGIAPGITLISGLQTEEEFERSHRNNPMGQGCTPEQILNAVDFILTTPSYHGQTLVIDGGQVLQRRPRDVVFLERPAPPVV
ncbi:SDR family NAD(P)-dependent oxidoreductase [Acidocella aminolytica]|uniref:Oxidoreductase/short-chain dehydrogenase/reductase SDR n=1 Tax=Acidocella aminolytica 101 = DSM 11237 TaxID=1120923 RepID=A0A0D6PEF2_9PROT|nr:SDR family NAD(P)-dependent oxidoreductase [Acidocella aminolytica]GAN80120.1 oxidoreductase/short-chain dehydrogenase/reductase SDR [Acidocella aminolytica 101 = DSM 11237]GBQ38035.1 dehydrogenase [Acidocella aminolytica 101 = DSM 11237]SHE87104.1 short chain dehydrogenase [Acidocella aminolytica 101 = DSM 11237]